LIIYQFFDIITAFEVSLSFAAIEFLVMLFFVSKDNVANPGSTGGYGYYYNAEQNNNLLAVKGYNKFFKPVIDFFSQLFGPLYRNILAPIFGGIAKRCMSNDYMTHLINIVPFIFYCGVLSMSAYATIIAVWFFQTYAINII